MKKRRAKEEGERSANPGAKIPAEVNDEDDGRKVAENPPEAGNNVDSTAAAPPSLSAQGRQSNPEAENGGNGNGPPRPAVHYDPTIAAGMLLFAARELLRQIHWNAFEFKRDVVRNLARGLEQYMAMHTICAFIKRGLKGCPISSSCISQALDDKYKDPADVANGRKGGETAAANLSMGTGALSASQKKIQGKKVPVLFPYACSRDGLPTIFAPSLVNPDEKYLVFPPGLTYLQEQLLFQRFHELVKEITGTGATRT